MADRTNGNLALVEGPSKASNGFLTSAMTANDVMAQVQLIQNVLSTVMQKDQHFGTIPGTHKPSLFKAGAEKLCLLFRLDPQFDTTEVYDGQHLTVRSKCTLYHIPTGQRVGSGEGLCSSKEKKYAYRKDGKPNENLPDVWNTVVKMANKRALVAATLVSTAASDIFTQDVEDMPTILIDTPAEVKETKQTVPTPKPAKKAAEAEDADKVPASVTDASAPQLADGDRGDGAEDTREAVMLKAYSKEKTDKNSKAYRGVLLVHQDNSEKWWNTYHKETIDALTSMKGKPCLATLEMKGEYPLCHKLEVM